MRTFKAVLALSALSMLGGCVAVPVSPGYYQGPSGYYQGPSDYYYYQPAPVYYGPPAYFGPSFSIGIYGGRGGFRH